MDTTPQDQDRKNQELIDGIRKIFLPSTARLKPATEPATIFLVLPADSSSSAVKPEPSECE